MAILIDEYGGFAGVVSIEDLIEEVYQCGPHFKEANNFIWPFKLSNPRFGFNNKNHSYQNNGDWGNREERINELIARMN